MLAPHHSLLVCSNDRSVAMQPIRTPASSGTNDDDDDDGGQCVVLLEW